MQHNWWIDSHRSIAQTRCHIERTYTVKIQRTRSWNCATRAATWTSNLVIMLILSNPGPLPVPFHFLSLLHFPPSLHFILIPLSLEVGSLSPARGSGERCNKAPQRSREEPAAKRWAENKMFLVRAIWSTYSRKKLQIWQVKAQVFHLWVIETPKKIPHTKGEEQAQGPTPKYATDGKLLKVRLSNSRSKDPNGWTQSWNCKYGNISCRQLGPYLFFIVG